MKRANGIGPARSISPRMTATSAGSLSAASRSGTGRRCNCGPTSTAPILAPLPQRKPEPGSDERVTAQDDRDRRRRGCLGELPEPRVCDSLVEQEIGGEPILGWGPCGLIHAVTVGEEDPAVDEGTLTQVREQPAERRGSVAVEERAENGARRPLAGRSPCADRAPRRWLASARAIRRSSQASPEADVRPATISSARGSAATARTAARRSVTRAAVSGEAGPAVLPSRTRSSGPSMSTPSRQRRRRSDTS